ncbi:peptidoglycan-binding domain-containing protein [Acuticoccus sediminis]|uniref:peptidoglycan-binding domain-containing protein n=1 Tax=Acuticoccus sediminis TaxID=2184697 RepID=UPI001CFEBDE5|nr:peptidoglycan-binding domain-containing protein [Acuticoccus sediminis]
MIRSVSRPPATPRHALRWGLGALLTLTLLVAGPERLGIGTAPAAAFCVVIPGGGCVTGPLIRRRFERRRRVWTNRYRGKRVRASRDGGSSPRLRSAGGASLTHIDPEIQTALNSIGFPVGRADGLMGRKTRDGIRGFQTAIDQEATGTLTEAQRLLLLRAHATVVAEGLDIAPGDNAAFLQRVIAATAAPAGVAVAAVTAGGVTTDAEGTVPDDTSIPAPDGDAGMSPAAPNPFDTASQPGGMCDGIDPNADSAQVAAMDADTAMLTAYCGVRSYLIDIVDPTTLGADEGRGDLDTCADWANRTGLGEDDLDTLAPEDVSDTFADRVPMSQSEREATLDIAKTCIGLALRHDDPITARFYALYAVAMEDDGFGELVAAHHGLGRGEIDSPDAAADWYDWTAGALSDGATTVTGDDARIRAGLMRVLAAKADGLARAAAEAGPSAPPPPDTAVADPAAGSTEAGAAPMDAVPPSGDDAPAEPPPALWSLADEAAADLPELARLLRLSEEELDTLCKEPAQDALALRVCRIEAYARRDVDRMRALDEALSEIGDPIGTKAMSIWAWQDAPQPTSRSLAEAGDVKP